MYACCSNNHIYEFDSTTLLHTNTFTNPTYESSSFYIKIDLSVCGNYLASGSKDSDVYIWDTKDHLKQAVLKGHRAEVTSVAWSRKELKLASSSDDMSVRLWRPIKSESVRKSYLQDSFLGWAEQVEAPVPIVVNKRAPSPPIQPKVDFMSEQKENEVSRLASPCILSIPQKRPCIGNIQSVPAKKSGNLKRSTTILQFFKKVSDT